MKRGPAKTAEFAARVTVSLAPSRQAMSSARAPRREGASDSGAAPASATIHVAHVPTTARPRRLPAAYVVCRVSLNVPFRVEKMLFTSVPLNVPVMTPPSAVTLPLIV